MDKDTRRNQLKKKLWELPYSPEVENILYEYNQVTAYYENEIGHLRKKLYYTSQYLASILSDREERERAIMTNLDLSKEIQAIKDKIRQVGGYHITKENQRGLYIVQCYYKDFDQYVKHSHIPTNPITIFKDLHISQSFRVGDILYCRDE